MLLDLMTVALAEAKIMDPLTGEASQCFHPAWRVPLRPSLPSRGSPAAVTVSPAQRLGRHLAPLI